MAYQYRPFVRQIIYLNCIITFDINEPFGESLVAQYVLDELVGDEVQMSHAGRLELGGADVRRGHVWAAELHLFVRHDIVQMFGNAFHEPELRLWLGEVLEPVALGPHGQLQQQGHAHHPSAATGHRSRRTRHSRYGIILAGIPVGGYTRGHMSDRRRVRVVCLRVATHEECTDKGRREGSRRRLRPLDGCRRTDSVALCVRA